LSLGGFIDWFPGLGVVSAEFHGCPRWRQHCQPIEESEDRARIFRETSDVDHSVTQTMEPTALNGLRDALYATKKRPKEETDIVRIEEIRSVNNEIKAQRNAVRESAGLLHVAREMMNNAVKNRGCASRGGNAS
uniref:REM-1 domain-containing protein n=1 Tax=Gongylonema pulchrum TaxID=637853 RepID=A0A183DX78_9BILA